jgi:DNA-directed RNA polymerase specialized sigma24 family protein
MNKHANAIRTILAVFPDKKLAYDILDSRLLPHERDSIYYPDVEGLTLIETGEKMGYEETTIKKYRREAYKRLGAFLFLKTN